MSALSISYSVASSLLAFATPQSWSLPQNGSLHGVLVDRHLSLNLWIFIALAVLAHIILLSALLFRREDGRTYRVPKVAALACLSLLFIALTYRAETLWAARYSGANLAAMQVEVTGVQFAWYFRYPGADATFGRTLPGLVDAGAGNPLGIDATDPHSGDDLVSSELVLPVGREVDLRLRAQDVIHGFFVPAMRLKQNAVPGDVFHIHFTPQKTGSYAILCSQVCGLGHYRMQATMRVVSETDYAAWLRLKETR